MGLTSTGLGSGLDINGIVSALVDASYAPREATLNSREAEIETQISAIGTLKSVMTEFQDSLEKLQDFDTFATRTTKLSNDDYLSVDASAEAVAGSYNISVNRLAESHKVGSVAVADADATIGEGQLTINVGFDDSGNPDPDSQLVIDVEATDTMQDIVDKINSADDNPGVTATIINSDDGPRLVMSSDDTGLENQLTVSATNTSGSGLTDTFGTMEELVAAVDSEIVVDGITITSSSNSVSDAVSGLTLNLTDADPTKTTKLTVDTDDEAVKGEIEAFVESYNELIESIGNLTSYDPETEEAGALQGDSLVRGISNRMRNIMSSGATIDGEQMRLADFGISFDRYGKLEVDDEALDDAIANDMSNLSKMFATEDVGLAYVLDEAVEVYVGTGGLLDNRDEILNGQKDRIDDERETLARSQASYEDRLYQQFNAMDSAVFMFNQQAADVASRLNSLPGFVSQS